MPYPLRVIKPVHMTADGFTVFGSQQAVDNYLCHVHHL